MGFSFYYCCLTHGVLLTPTAVDYGNAQPQCINGEVFFYLKVLSHIHKLNNGKHKKKHFLIQPNVVLCNEVS